MVFIIKYTYKRYDGTFYYVVYMDDVYLSFYIMLIQKSFELVAITYIYIHYSK